mmetsp:Transcript_40062/g.85847  ORF Transcript_40062/g.85847 Transcript_40062/m.85847 type:complete len:277 (-) Transcript_40062:281-1111(-)|eukprot:CAMPEP_0206446860 /NCGR_PEP_ID=MMETSP0324_2-20121206/16407_1 /ASSEMBLY_ACC=CAM_ASM_000836 /TAXON_ID=2866 /ORGANISM="Crypthecodinium cohnii, Strain Seligo" /LENGTH=276 /DNA_ID=CAMNT_0053915451 /DNA_START=342 /DNA_END=1175 /DNA_ORIENTATION=+
MELEQLLKEVAVSEKSSSEDKDFSFPKWNRNRSESPVSEKTRAFERSPTETTNSSCFDFQHQRDINRAQMDAIVQRTSGSGDLNALKVQESSFYGNWTDSFGNAVCVYSTDAFTSQLVASLSKPPRPDINLQIRRAEGGSGWMCGKAYLSFVDDALSTLHWTFPNGVTSAWCRPASVCSTDGAASTAAPLKAGCKSVRIDACSYTACTGSAPWTGTCGPMMGSMSPQAHLPGYFPYPGNNYMTFTGPNLPPNIQICQPAEEEDSFYGFLLVPMVVS